MKIIRKQPQDNWIVAFAAIAICVQLFQIALYASQQNLRMYFYILMALWLSIRLACVVLSFITNYKSESKKTLKDTLLIFFTCELLFLTLKMQPNQRKKLIQGFIGQIYIYSVPVLFVSQYILGNEQVYHVYIRYCMWIVIIINLVLLSLCNFLNVLSNSEEENSYKTNFPSNLLVVCRAFAFWYTFTQFVSINYIFVILCIVVHLCLGIGISANSSNTDQRVDYYISYMLFLDKYIIDIEYYTRKAEKADDQQRNQINTKLDIKLVDIVYHIMLQLYLTCFIILKIIYNPFLSNFDYTAYVTYVISLPLLYASFKQIYYRFTLIKEHLSIIKWEYGTLELIPLIKKLSRKLVYDGKLYINLEEVKQEINKLAASPQRECGQNSLTKSQCRKKEMIWINQKQFFDDLNEIKISLLESEKGGYQSLQIHFFDESKNIQLIFLVRQNQDLYQKLILRAGYDQSFASEFLDFFQFLINPNLSLTVETFEKDSEIAHLRLSSLRFQPDQFLTNEKHQQIIQQALSCNYQALAFYKQLTTLIPLNPSMVLFDLLDNHSS